MGERLGAAFNLRDVPPQGTALPLIRQLKPLLGSPSLRPISWELPLHQMPLSCSSDWSDSSRGAGTPSGVNNHLYWESRISLRC